MKKFIIILFAIFFTGCFANKQISGTNLKPKCDYYIDNIERLYTEPFDNITATGIVCDSKNNKSYIPIKNGLAHGKAEIYADNGTSWEINFKEGKRNGETKTFQNGILISSINFMQDGEVLISLYRPNGQLEYSLYNNGKEGSLLKEYDEYGNLIEETPYANGKKNGTAKEYYENGVLKTEAQFINDKQNGIQKDYYETGALKSEKPYKNNKLEGVGKSYYENGALETEISFKNGKLEGMMNMYNQDGVLDIQITHKNGLKSGPMKKYNSDGSYWATITYQNDKPVSGKCANGRKWNNAELSNWENGLNVTCGY